jgi:Transposase DDE domain group 1
VRLFADVPRRTSRSLLDRRHGDEPLRSPNRAVVRFYNKRDTAEQWIKEGKQAAHWTRLSCHRFRANELRLRLSVIASNLVNLAASAVVRLSVALTAMTGGTEQ